ncbi:unnamed protein product [Prunus armeniaca]
MSSRVEAIRPTQKSTCCWQNSKVEGGSEQILVPIDRLFGQEECIINSSHFPVSPISRNEPVNPVSPLHWTVSHFTRGE